MLDSEERIVQAANPEIFTVRVEIQGDPGEGLAYVQVCVTLVKLFSPLNRSFSF